MYLPKFKQKAGGDVPGILVDPKTKLRYTGKYVKDFKGNFFKGEQITSKSEPLELQQSETVDRKLNFYSDAISPTASDYKRGYMIRYFAKDGRNGKIIELNKKNYLIRQQEAKLYIRTAKTAWYITGEPEDQIINGYLYPGTKAKNQDVVNQLDKDIPGIGDQILKDLAQFVR